MPETLLERWPGYNEQSWKERYMQLDREFIAAHVKFQAALASLQPSVSEMRDSVERAWLDIRERLNREHAEGIITYRELKAGINNAAVIREAALSPEGEP